MATDDGDAALTIILSQLRGLILSPSQQRELDALMTLCSSNWTLCREGFAAIERKLEKDLTECKEGEHSLSPSDDSQGKQLSSIARCFDPGLANLVDRIRPTACPKYSRLVEHGELASACD